MVTVRTRIGPADHGRRMTFEEFRDAEEKGGYRYELARGVLEVSNFPDERRCQVISNTHQQFSRYRAQGGGLVLRIGHADHVRIIVAGEDTARHPDLGVVFRGAGLDSQGRRRSTLIVEVLTNEPHDRRSIIADKREDYLAAGLLEFWIVDLKLRQVIVLTRREVASVTSWSERVFRDAEVIVSDSLPGFAGTVAELWADVDDDD